MHEQRVVRSGADEVLEAVERNCPGEEVVELARRQVPLGGGDEIDRVDRAVAEPGPLVAAIAKALPAEPGPDRREILVADEQVEVAPDPRQRAEDEHGRRCGRIDRARRGRGRSLEQGHRARIGSSRERHEPRGQTRQVTTACPRPAASWKKSLSSRNASRSHSPSLDSQPPG